MYYFLQGVCNLYLEMTESTEYMSLEMKTSNKSKISSSVL